MSEHPRLIEALYTELVLKGFDNNGESYIEAADEILQELDRLIQSSNPSRFQAAWYAESGYWLFRIKDLALAAAVNR